MPLVQLKAQGSVDGMEERMQMEEVVLVKKPLRTAKEITLVFPFLITNP